MSSIGPTGSAPTPLPAPGAPAPTAAAAPPPPLPPIFQQAFSGAGLAGALGLAPPRSPGNTEALFLEITGKLESAKSEAEEAGDTSESESRRTEFASAAAILNRLLDITNGIQIHQDNVKKQDETIVQLNEQKQPLIDQRTALQNNINTYQGYISKENTNIANRQAQNVFYEIAKALTTDPDVKAQYDALIANNNYWIGVSQNNINVYQNQINAWQGQINSLNSQIAAIDGLIDAADTSKKNSEAEIGRLQAAYNDVMLSLFPMAIAMMLGPKSEAGREAAENPEVLTAFDNIAEGALAEANRVPLAELEFEQFRGKVMEGNTLDPSRADRVSFRFASFVSSVQAAFAGLDTLGQMADLATSGGAPTINGRERIAI